MTLEKLERVMWRLRKDNAKIERVTLGALRRAIMIEIGTDERTYYANKKALIKLKWIITLKGQYVELTGNDLTGEF